MPKINAKKKADTDAEAAMLNILEDTIEQKRHAEEEREKAEITLKSIGDGAFVVDQNGKVTFFNPQSEEISGYQAKEIVGKAYNEVLQFVLEKDKQKRSMVVEEAIEARKIIKSSSDTLLIRKDGEAVPVSDSAAPILIEDQVIGCVVVFRDMTREREIDRRKTEFISIASHQLRSPVSSIKWLVELLLENRQNFNEENVSYIKDIDALVKNLNDLVRTLLNISRIESDYLEIAPKQINLSTYIKQMVEEYRKKLAEHNGKISFSCTIKQFPTLPIDDALLSQVLRVLIDNAIKYSKQDSIMVRVKLAKAKNGDYLVSVTDSGIGIPKEEQKNIFERFFRTTIAQKHTHEGTGLGLYMAKIITQNFGGAISFASSAKGTTFTFSVPQKGMKERLFEHGKSLEIVT